MPESPEPTSLDAYIAAVETLFEGGRYRDALATISTALEQHPDNPDLLLWQAIATNAVGQTEEAISMVTPLKISGDLETRQKARYLAQIWSAPSLNRPKEWKVNMADFSQIDSGFSTVYVAANPLNEDRSAKKSKKKFPLYPSGQLKFWPTVLSIGAIAIAISCTLIVSIH
ncbi:MAG: tetratricopeptide repeat protein [Synechococcus sp.]